MCRLASSLAQPAALANIPHFLFKYLHKSNTTGVTEANQPMKPFYDHFSLLKPLCWFQQLDSVYKCSVFHSIESKGTVVTGTQCISEVNPTAVSLSYHLSVGLSVLIQLLFSCTDADRLTTGTKRKAKLVTREEKQIRWSREGEQRRDGKPFITSAIPDGGPYLAHSFFGGVIPSLSPFLSTFQKKKIYLQSVAAGEILIFNLKLFCCLMVTNISG